MKHLAIIADGNRRWAKNHGLSPKKGYDHGTLTIENTCLWAIENNIKYLTVYCFSTENWARPVEEVQYLMDLARRYFENKKDWYVKKGIRVIFSGRKDRVDEDLLFKSNKIEEVTLQGQNLTLVICLDYGGRDEIARAIAAGARTEEEITLLLSQDIPEPDAILRTGGEYRLSNFLLWQAAYSELFFSDTLFPDLDFLELDNILIEYRKRKRNFGK